MTENPGAPQSMEKQPVTGIRHDLPVNAPKALIRAQTDAEAVAVWLADCRTKKTLRAYKREAERLLFWCRQRNLTLRDLAYEDLLLFSAFLMAPPPEWISTAKLPRAHPDWRPMTGPLKPRSHSLAIIIIRKMLKWLHQTGYLPSNPGSLLKPGRARTEAEITRYLPVEALSWVDEAVDQLPENTPTYRKQKARARFLVSLYYEPGIRLFEGAGATMGDMVRDHHGHWWLYIIGKGDTEKRPVPVSERLLADFQSYREAYRKPPLPAPGDPEPLVLTTRGPERRATDEAVADALQAVFRRAGRLADAAGQPELAKLLRQASPHWLRHSCMSHLLDDGTDLATVQAVARHRSIATTGRYLHKRSEDVHAAVSRRSATRKT